MVIDDKYLQNGKLLLKYNNIIILIINNIPTWQPRKMTGIRCHYGFRVVGVVDVVRVVIVGVCGLHMTCIIVSVKAQRASL